MVYKAIGLMSGSSLDGLDIAYVSLQETGGKWSYEFLHTECASYSTDWMHQLKNAIKLSGLDYQLLHTAYGHILERKLTGLLIKKEFITRCTWLPPMATLLFMYPKN